jgi:hypothetical protein
VKKKDLFYYAIIAIQKFTENKFAIYIIKVYICCVNGQVVKESSYKVEILEEFDSEKECLEKESNLIRFHGCLWNNTGTLCNRVIDFDEAQALRVKGAIKKTSKIIYQYDLYGNYIKSFTSMANAINECKCDVYNAVSGRNKTSGGFQWRNYKCKKISPCNGIIINTKNKKICNYTVSSKEVYQYDENYILINKWKSSKEASVKLNINYNSIRNCLCKYAKNAGGFKWEYCIVEDKNIIKKYGVYKDNKLVFSSNKLKKCSEYLNVSPECVSVYLRLEKPYKGYTFKNHTL